jgi:colanic acid/amylovoran biosynthesis protein
VNILLKGGEFNNKGAEAMTLVALKNIYEIDKDANVYMLYSKQLVPFEFYHKINFIEVSAYFVDYVFGNYNYNRVKSQMKDIVKLFIPGKKNFIKNNKKTLNVLKTIDVTIDISGFALGDKWGKDAAIRYCSWIELLTTLGSKVYLMPQSFGPFNFDKETIEYITKSLKCVTKIYAREESGYKELIDFGLKNVTMSYDSVLLEKNFDPSIVIKNISRYKEEIDATYLHNIGIVPNYRLFDRGGTDKMIMLAYYQNIIKRYVSDNRYCFYLLSHAGEDLKICREIKKMFNDKSNVILVDHVLYSFNYENFIKKMDFIVASRYHSIVHAYKEGIPAIIIGWSDKYNALAATFNQKKYIVDTKYLENDGIKVYSQMINNYADERESIISKLSEVQTKKCYDFLYDL